MSQHSSFSATAAARQLLTLAGLLTLWLQQFAGIPRLQVVCVEYVMLGSVQGGGGLASSGTAGTASDLELA